MLTIENSRGTNSLHELPLRKFPALSAVIAALAFLAGIIGCFAGKGGYQVVAEVMALAFNVTMALGMIFSRRLYEYCRAQEGRWDVKDGNIDWITTKYHDTPFVMYVRDTHEHEKVYACRQSSLWGMAAGVLAIFKGVREGDLRSAVKR